MNICTVHLAVLTFSVGVSACQPVVEPRKTSPITPSETRPIPNAGPLATDARSNSIAYIDLGPIRDRYGSTNVSNQSLDIPSTPSEPLVARQLDGSVESGREIVEADQLSGTLPDRCDPSYWGGQLPAGANCTSALPDLDSEGERPLVAVDETGAYIRLTPENSPVLQDSDRVARNVETFDGRLPDPTLGAILLDQSTRPTPPPDPIPDPPADFLLLEAIVGEGNLPTVTYRPGS